MKVRGEFFFFFLSFFRGDMRASGASGTEFLCIQLLGMLEFDLVKQAIWSDPNDQSAWLYHRWLVGKGKWLPLQFLSFAHVLTASSLLVQEKLH